MGCYISWRCLFLVLWVLHSMFVSSSGCFVEERAALMDISSWFVSAKSEVPSSWAHGDDCCLWERITCNNSTRRILRLNLSFMYESIPTYGDDGSTSVAAMQGACWNLNLTIFSSFWDLQLLDFSGNCACLQNFQGNIPGSVSNLASLEVMNLSGNNTGGALQDVGSIPPCIGGIPFEYPDGYKYIWPTSGGNFYGGGFDAKDFSYNSHYDLQGFTFTTKGNTYTYGPNFFMAMSGIDLSANMLSGEIPQEIGNLSHTKSLNLSNNFFTGSIPATFANLSEIESLDLSKNRLNGSITWQLTRLSSLGVFSVAYNNLSGCLPDSGQFGTFGMDSYRGNDNLRSCTSSSGPVAPNGTVGNVSDDSDPILYVVTVVSFVLAFWATVTFIFCHSFGQRVFLKL